MAEWQIRASVGRGAKQFETEIFPEEIATINERRKEHHRPPLVAHEKKCVDAVGLALSGGGVRSAAFSLGVLQALNQDDVLKHIDYLSTVSGGGYIGCAMTATMTKTNGDFVFGTQSNPGAPSASDIADTDPVGHIRNYSNYLIPYGFRDVMTGAAIIVRGLVANLGLVLPVILIAAAVTVAINPDRTSLRQPDLFGRWQPSFIPAQHFGFTLVLAILGLIAFFAWAVRRSYLKVNELGEFRGRWPAYYAWFLGILAIVLFMEVQPAVISNMFDAAAKKGDTTGLFSSVVASWVQWLIALSAPFAAVVTFFNKHFADAIKVGNKGTGWTQALYGLGARAAVWVAGAALPLIIWVGYLYLCFWGIPNSEAVTITNGEAPAIAGEAEASGNPITLTFEIGSLSGTAEGTLNDADAKACPDQESGEAAKPVTPTSHRPTWLAAPLGWVGSLWDLLYPPTSDAPRAILLEPRPESPAPKPIPWDVVVLYSALGILIGLFALLLRPNSNSLNRLYQDRLSKAFLFNPLKRMEGGGITGGRDFAPLDIQLSTLRNKYVPYHLINAAVNVQGSDFANRLGRNADFFLFSPRYVGSAATGYVSTEFYEPDPPDLDVAKALSVSGAAFSSEMGSKSIRALAPTLALLNVRLGYWLKNPRDVERDATSGQWMKQRQGGPRLAPLYLLREMLGWLDENTPVVHVTDGGHIENLGIYELLRRRCKLIMAVDAEADPTMDFPSFIDLQRYARIDFGYRFRIPWQEITDGTLAWMGAGSPTNPEPDAEPARGPHVAVGTIDYGDGETGFLVYVKSSLSGDENDYIRDYARRNPKFPHETTGDQFFSEEQFEVYRALGFHAMFGFLDGSADVVVDPKLPQPPGAPAPQAAPSAATAGTTPGASTPPVGTPPQSGVPSSSAPVMTDKAGKALKQSVVVRGDDASLAEIRKMLGL